MTGTIIGSEWVFRSSFGRRITCSSGAIDAFHPSWVVFCCLNSLLRDSPVCPVNACPHTLPVCLHALITLCPMADVASGYFSSYSVLSL